jgi:hypothetical protein
MTEPNSEVPNNDEADSLPDSAARLRGDALNGAEQRSSVLHGAYERARNPDAELRLDGEDETLYSDGLDIGDDSETLAGTDGDAGKGYKG